MEIKKVRLQLNNGKRSILKLPNKWLTNLGIDISLTSKDEIELLYEDDKIIIRRVEDVN